MAVTAPSVRERLESPRDLIDAELFGKLVAHVRKEKPAAPADHAERVVEQALVFLVAAPTAPWLSPTKAVDAGWHAFILHTADYAEFCARVLGTFIHHNPVCTDDIRSGAALQRTLEALQKTGYRVDPDLWTVSDPADCNQCHATCYNSP